MLVSLANRIVHRHPINYPFVTETLRENLRGSVHLYYVQVDKKCAHRTCDNCCWNCCSSIEWPRNHMRCRGNKRFGRQRLPRLWHLSASTSSAWYTTERRQQHLPMSQLYKISFLFLVMFTISLSDLISM